MINITNVEKGLYDYLLTIPNLPTNIQREGTIYKPDIRDDWMHTKLLPNEPSKQSIGLNGLNLLQGIYEIDLYFASGRTGIEDMNKMADDITNAYMVQLFIVEGDVRIEIQMAWRDVAAPDEEWFRLPILINWTSQQSRT